MQKTFLRESGRGEKARVLEIVGDWCESLHVCARLLKKKARASKDKRFQGVTQTLDFFK